MYIILHMYRPLFDFFKTRGFSLSEAPGNVKVAVLHLVDFKTAISGNLLDSNLVNFNALDNLRVV